MKLSLVDYAVATITPLPPIDNCLYQYIMAGNGIFIRAANRAFTIVSQIAAARVAGLAEVEETFTFHLPRIPAAMFENLLNLCRQSFFHELYLQLAFDGESWQFSKPQQVASGGSVQWVGGDSCDIELHTHPYHSAKFSVTDDRDEQGLCVYAVIGFGKGNPEISVRVGVYGQKYIYVPASTIFELPQTLPDRYYQKFLDNACTTTN